METCIESSSSKQQKTCTFDAALETLEGASLTFTNASTELLSPMKTNSDEVATTPVVTVAETVSETMTKQSFTTSDGKEHMETGNESEEMEQKSDTIEMLKEEVEMAMVASMACYKKLKSILDLVSTGDDISQFSARSDQKIRDVLRVLKKGVMVKKVTEYKLVVDDEVV